MRYWTFVLLGLAIAGASLVAADWGLFHVVRTGTCSSGGPYISARPCPPGTGAHIAAVTIGVFTGLLGTGIYAARGPGGRPSPIGVGTVMWILLFTTIAGTVIYAAYGPGSDHSAGAQTTAVILGVIFIPMGLAPLAMIPLGRRKAAATQGLLDTGRRAPGQVVSVDDTNVTINDNPRVRITVRVDPPGEAPFTLVKTQTVSRVSIPRAGDTCSVLYDPADPQFRNTVAFGGAAAAFTPAASVAQAPRAPAPAPAAPAAAQPAADPVARLEQLAGLRDQGLITDAEFADKKRRLLEEI